MVVKQPDIWMGKKKKQKTKNPRPLFHEVKVTQSCPTLWDPMHYTVHGILQARILDWVAIPFSRGSSQSKDWTRVSYVSCIGRQVLYLVSRSVMSNSLWPHGLLCPWYSPGRNTGVGSHSLLQGIFPIQGLNPGLLHYRKIIYCLSHQGRLK